MPANPAGDVPPLEIPITGELDLHTFRPEDLKELLPAYFQACLARGLTEVRIIHGKGTGTLRRVVHSALERHPLVESFELAGERSGAWGATFAVLRPPPSAPPAPD